jgi:hypothetical protein
MTATEHTVEDETPPLAVESAEVSLKRSASVPSNGTKWCTKKSDGACTSSQKMTILSHRKANPELDGIFRQKSLEDCVT